MSSWKKASKTNQRTHHERHQPSTRQHLGLLEKKKDYKQRAKNYQQRQATIKLLKKRALNRNPDEFYFHMINSRVEEGEHHEVEKKDEHTPDQIKLMDTQDIAYVTTKRTIENRKINRLQSQLHLLDAANDTKNTHIFFVDTKEEAKKFDVADRLDTHPLLLDRRVNRPRLSTLETMKLPAVDEKILKEGVAERDKKYRELAKRLEREKQLYVVQQKLEMKRFLQQKRELKPKLVKPATEDAPALYKFRAERKR